MSKIIRTDAEGNEIVQGSDQWKALRVGMVTGTVIASLMGTPAAYKKAVQAMVAERLTGKRASVKATGSMKQGVEREPFARMWYEERTGRIVEEVAFVQHDWMKVGVSPDGMILGEQRLVEFKSPEQDAHSEYLLYEDYPKTGPYYGQMQAQLWITGYELCDFCSFNPDFTHEGLQGHIVEVARDEVYIAQLEDKVATFLFEVSVKVKEFTALGDARALATTHAEVA